MANETTNPDEIMEMVRWKYHIALSTGGDIIVSRKKFILTSATPLCGQFLSSMWFNPLIKPKNYKKDIWIAIIKVSKRDRGEERLSVIDQLQSTQPSSWSDLSCVACVSKYNWEGFYEDITDSSKYLKSDNACESKTTSVSLPCSRYGDTMRINFTVATSYTSNNNYDSSEEDHLFRNPDDPKNSDILQVSIQCPSFNFT